MASGKEIRTKIKSINSTRKITRAMEMVAASKMRKAQERMQTSRPYAEKIRDVVGHAARSHAEYKHLYLAAHTDIKRVGIIVVSSDRGLCGGLNINLLKAVNQSIQEWQQQDIAVDLCTLGQKAFQYFKRRKLNIVGHTEHMGDHPNVQDLIGLVKVVLDAFKESKLDQLFIAFNRFVNTMCQQAQVLQLLPIAPTETEKLNYYWDYIYEPDSKQVLDALLSRYVESQVYQAVVENIACEQAARMVAMKSASDNAASLIDELQLAYNKARQAMITQELSEIVSGASAV